MELSACRAVAFEDCCPHEEILHPWRTKDANFLHADNENSYQIIRGAHVKRSIFSRYGSIVIVCVIIHLEKKCVTFYSCILPCYWSFTNRLDHH